MNTITFAGAILDRLAATLPPTVQAHDGLPEVPAGSYCYVTFDGGTGARRDVARTSQTNHLAHIVCVGIDPTGARFVADRVRNALLDHRLDGNHPLREEPAGPPLTDGVEGDRRTSITLTYALPTRRNP